MQSIDLGQQFGRYRILRRLGAGGMGAVFLAEDEQLQRRVALKVPHQMKNLPPKLFERFRREARAMADIAHPNLCPVYDIGDVDDIHYLTMPYIKGSPLSKLVAAGKPLVPAQVARLVRKLAVAVGVLHERGIIHRDLKPHNIMVRPGGEPVVMDFGLACSLTDSDKRLTTTGALVGTPAYLSPEQVLGESNAIGPATDVYALGVILFELLTGQLPFPGPGAALFGQILHQAPPAPAQVRPGLDAVLGAICLKAMAKNRTERFASMAALVTDLDRFLARQTPGIAASRFATAQANGRPVKAIPGPSFATRTPRIAPVAEASPRWHGKTSKPKRRPRRLFAAALLMTSLALTAAAGWYWYTNPEARPAGEGAQPHVDQGTPKSAPERDRKPIAPEVKPPSSNLGQLPVSLAKKEAPSLTAPKTVPSNADKAKALVMRGNSWLIQKNDDLAIEAFGEAIQLDPRLVPAYLNRAKALMRKKRYQPAAEDLGKVLALDPQNVEALHQRGLAWRHQGKYDRAIEDFDQAITHGFAIAALFHDRGLCWRNKGNYQLAIADYDQAIRLDPNYVQAYLDRGSAWRFKKDDSRALQDYSQAIQLDPKNTIAFVNRGWIWLAKKDNKRAIQDFDEAIRLDPESPRVHVDSAMAWKGMGDYQRAIQEFDEAIRLNPKEATVYNYRGWAWRDLGKWANAIEDFEAAMRLNPRWTNAYWDLAWVLTTCPDVQFRDAKRAVAVAELLCKESQWKKGSHLDLLSVACAAAGRFQDAIQYQQQALMDSDWARANGTRSRERIALFREKKALP